MFYLYTPMIPTTANQTLYGYLGYAAIVFKDFFSLD